MDTEEHLAQTTKGNSVSIVFCTEKTLEMRMSIEQLYAIMNARVRIELRI